jgi:hypothetical protein
MALVRNHTMADILSNSTEIVADFLNDGEQPEPYESNGREPKMYQRMFGLILPSRFFPQ